ncbi:hypothetical protein J2W68_002906 [Luteimonas terrae]|uniref:Uncharacterized protein n=1 Tax=Luteimonas terrae TaxID=1530191 RepID=A0ABU1XZG7_9GAMM|nr:hypothetical protein [Luteimonas terrae]
MTEMIPHEVPARRPQDDEGDLIGSSALRSWKQPT